MAVMQGRFMPTPTAVTADNIQDIAINQDGKLLTSGDYQDDAVLRIVPIASNGTTPVELVAAVAGQTVYPVLLVFANGSATDRTLRLFTAATEILRIAVPGSGSVDIDLGGSVRTDTAEALNFNLTDAAITDVFVSGTAQQR
jgi:hypothetical protein